MLLNHADPGSGGIASHVIQPVSIGSSLRAEKIFAV